MTIAFEGIVQYVDGQFGQLIATQTKYAEIRQPIFRFECVYWFDIIVIQIDIVYGTIDGLQRLNATDLQAKMKMFIKSISCGRNGRNPLDCSSHRKWLCCRAQRMANALVPSGCNWSHTLAWMSHFRLSAGHTTIGKCNSLVRDLCDIFLEVSANEMNHASFVFGTFSSDPIVLTNL